MSKRRRRRKQLKIFTYSCVKVVKVIDGDTVDIRVDLGFNIFTVQRFRLARIDAPEPRGETRKAGLAATEYLRNLLDTIDTRRDQEADPQGTRRLLITTSPEMGKFNHWTAELILSDFDTLIRVSDLMVRDGHAIYKDYN